eukprot:TRINITY_DN64849_c0_g1_i1.p1 TRINITY_DN64849_c0_g1~~TRINITY_DN64849_c0_g1_i1.p1  ORF type:complete len:4109 (+),score=1223.61 TRINITY_DN64849_c0_g1_i1:127-12327(+)
MRAAAARAVVPLLLALRAADAEDLPMSAKEIEYIMGIMNDARAGRGACPLQWDESIVKTTLTRTGSGADTECPKHCNTGAAPCGTANPGEYQYSMVGEWFDPETGATPDSPDMSGAEVIRERLFTWTDPNSGEAQKFEQGGAVAGTEHYQKVVNTKATKVGCSICLGTLQRSWGLDQWHFVLCLWDDSQGTAVPAAQIKDQGTQCDKCDQITCGAPPSQCHADQGTCTSTTGECNYGMKADDTPCDDGDADTIDDVCVGGVCVGYDQCHKVSCPAKNPCYDPGVCNPKTGLCEDQPKTLYVDTGFIAGRRASVLLAPPAGQDPAVSCDDGDAATSDDTCECPEDTTNTDQTVKKYVCTGKCSGTDKCSQAAPVNHPGCQPPVCRVCNNCCDPLTGACSFSLAAKGTPCDDGRVETRDDQCDDQGTCVGVSVCIGKDGMQKQCLSFAVGKLSCQTQGECDPTNLDSEGYAQCKYSYKDENAACDDNDPLTVHDVCKRNTAGVLQCEGVSPCEYPVKVTCSTPPDQCHKAGSCDPFTGKCVYPRNEITFADAGGAVATPITCDDGDKDTINDICQWHGSEYTCVGVNLCLLDNGQPKDCGPPRTQCHAPPECDHQDGECKEKLLDAGTACDDGSNLTVKDECKHTNAAKFEAVCEGTDLCAGKGPGGARLACDARKDVPALACRKQGWCESATGKCNYNRAEYNEPEGTPCDDGDPGTVLDKCTVDPADGMSKCKGEPPCASEIVELAGSPGVFVCPWKPWGDQGVNQDCNEAYCNPDTNKCELRAYPRASGVGGCDDGDAVTVEDRCTPVNQTINVGSPAVPVTIPVGKCAGEDKCGQNEKPKRKCPVRNDCYRPGICKIETGLCEYTNMGAGAICDDKVDKTVDDKCVAVGAELVCVGTDKCANVTCSQAPTDCELPGTCDQQTGGCVYPKAARGHSCDDGDQKTVFDHCDGNGVCAGIDLCKGVGCGSPGQCYEQGSCDHATGACNIPLKPAGTTCDDGEPKTKDDQCDAQGVCEGTNRCLDPATGENKKCPAKGQCHLPGTCDYDTGKCTEPVKTAGTACDDGSDTTKDDVCDGVQANPTCKGVDKCLGVDCTTKAQCYIDGSCEAQTGNCVCAQGQWVEGRGCGTYNVACDDGIAETVHDKCKYDQNKATGPTNPLRCTGVNLCDGVTCRPQSQCHEPGVCDYQTGRCSAPFKNFATPCDDGDSRTTGDRCDGKGTCEGVDLCAGVRCPAIDDCHDPGTCDHQTGSCSAPNKADGTDCDDADMTSVNDRCQGGKCVGEKKCGGQQCTTQRKCYIGWCEVVKGATAKDDVNQCSEKPGQLDVPCDDEDDTTKDDTCVLSVDLGCTTGCDSSCDASCDAAGGAGCDDGCDDSCDTDCSPPPAPPGGFEAVCKGDKKCLNVTCPAPNECHEEGVCEPTTGQCKPVFKPDDTQCDDADPQTVGDVCKGGGCAGVNLCLGKSCPAISQCHQVGKCNFADGSCSSEPMPNGHNCDDGNVKTVNDKCDGKGKCIGEDLCSPNGVAKKCDPRHSCENPGTCNYLTGKCEWSLRSKGLPCDDGDAKTVGDKCSDRGLCIGVNLCDGVKCRASTCRFAGVCDYQTGSCTAPKMPAQTPCDDGNNDTVADKCGANAQCIGIDKCLENGKRKQCPAIDDCHTAGECNKYTGECSAPVQPDNTDCDDGNPLTVEDKCTGGVCEGVDKCKGKIKECGEDWVNQNPACNMQGTCDIYTGQCTNPFVPDGTKCDDKDPNTLNDMCQKGRCSGYDPCLNIDCQPINSCHEKVSCTIDSAGKGGECKPKRVAVGTQCDDGANHTVADTCRDVGGVHQCAGHKPCGGPCAPPTEKCKVVTCVVDYSNPADKGTCTVSNEQDGVPCDDGKAETVFDHCTGGTCSGIDLCAGIKCGQRSQCHDVGICVHADGSCPTPEKADGTPCDDGDQWTANDQCKGGVCKGVDLCNARNIDKDGKVCRPKNTCYTDSICQPATGKCSDGTPKQADASCDDGDRQTVGDQCAAAAGGAAGAMECKGTNPCDHYVCKASSQCHDIGKCTVDDMGHPKCSDPVKPTGTQCDDKDPKTVDDKCGRDGGCHGVDLCSKRPPCVLPRGADPQCNTPGKCQYADGTCSAHTVTPKKACDDGNQRTVNDECVDKAGVGICQGVDLCKNTPPCTAADQCTENGRCDPQTGKCVPGGPKPLGTPCDDGELTTKDDACSGSAASPVCKGVDVCANVTCAAPQNQCMRQGKCDATRFKIPGGGYGTRACASSSFSFSLSVSASISHVTARGTTSSKHSYSFSGSYAFSMTQTSGPDVNSQIAGNNPGDPDGLCTSPAEADLTTCDDGDDDTIADACIGGECKGISCNIQVLRARWGPGTCTFGSRGEGGGYGWTPCGNLYVDGKCGGTFLVEATGETIHCPGDGRYKVCRRSLRWQSPKARTEVRDIWSIIKYGTGGQPGCVPTPEKPGCKKSVCWTDQGKGCCADANKKKFASFTTSKDMFAESDCLKFAEGYTDQVVGIEWNDKDKTCALLVAPGEQLAAPAGGWAKESDGEQGQAPVEGTTQQGCPNTVCISPKNRCIGVRCSKQGDCTKKGQCEGHSGRCTNPPELAGSACDDGDPSTTNDVCDGSGNCTGTNPPGCFVRGMSTPAQTCRHDPRRCSDAWGQDVWGTMEECCRPGAAHKTGCAPAPDPDPKECWRADKWWPRRECVKDMNSCKWGNIGQSVFTSKKECCKPGSAFPCGCTPPPGPPRKCFVKSTNSFDQQGRWKRECVDDQDRCDDSSVTVYSSRDACCKKEWAPYGCTLPCKALDLVLVLDGSGSMSNRFGRHSHGFYGVMSMLRDWVDRLPLTGEKAGQAMANLPNGGVRVGLVQFSGSNPYYGRRGQTKAIKSPNYYRRKKLTGGRLSGDKEELLADIDWHHRNYMRQGTMIEMGIRMAAQMFEDRAPGRQHAVILLTDGQIFDANRLQGVRRLLDDKKAIVFGVVVRRTSGHTRTDTSAEKSLKPVLSGIVDEHFYNIQIEDIPDKVLNGVCDPNSPWGAYLKPQVAAVVAKQPASVIKTATGQNPIWDRQRKLKPFPDLDCDEVVQGGSCTCAEPLAGAIVSIESPGYDKHNDRLSCSGCRKLGISAEWKSTPGMLYLTGYRKNLGDFTAALKEVEFYTSARDTEKRVFTYNYGEGWGTSTSQGHFYQYYPRSRITWDEAEQACEKKKILGMPGYLMTVTTKAEQDLAKSKLAGEGWMGASDAGTEGTWRWVTGPEGCPPGASCNTNDGMGLSTWKRTRGNSRSGNNRNGGTHFFTQQRSGGSAQSGCADKDPKTGKCFVNWAGGEPNEYRSSCSGDCRCCGEDFAHFWWPQGSWNDFPRYHSEIRGYICEWGGIGKACLKAPLGTREYVHSSTPQPAPPTPPATDPCLLPPEKPDPLPAGGCATQWVLTPAGEKAKWTEADCPKKCVLPGGSTLDLACRPTSGSFQKCRCPLAAATAQCQCGSYENGLDPQEEEYCASKKRDDKVNGKMCYPIVEPLFSIANEPGWDSDDSYYGKAPATLGDNDSSFTCLTYNRASTQWATTSFVGQCQDKDQSYFARYQAGVYSETAEQSCKKLCEHPSRPECHSIHWGEAQTDEDKELCQRLSRKPASCHVCTLNVEPQGQKCGDDQVLCRRPQAQPPAGDRCGCTKFRRGAERRHSSFCTKDNIWANTKDCVPPNQQGGCDQGYTLCGGKPVQTLTCKAGQCTDPTKTAGTIGGGANVVPSVVTIHSICPASACSAPGSCSTLDLKRKAGCAVSEFSCGNSWVPNACDRFRNGAKQGDGVVCRKKEGRYYLCMPPNRGDKKCPGDHDRCEYKVNMQKTSARHAHALANEDVTVDFGFGGLGGDDAAAASNQLNSQLQITQAEGVPAGDDALKAFTGSAATQASAPDATSATVVVPELDPNVPAPGNPGGTGTTGGSASGGGTSGGAAGDGDGDDGSSAGGIIGAVAGGVVLVAGVAAFALHRRSKVTWADVAVRRESVGEIQVTSPTGDKGAASYQEMQGKPAPAGGSPSSPSGGLGPTSGSPRASLLAGEGQALNRQGSNRSATALGPGSPSKAQEVEL